MASILLETEALLGRQWCCDGPDNHGEAVSWWQADGGWGEVLKAAGGARSESDWPTMSADGIILVNHERYKTSR